jgi:hypothetical protein
MSDKKQNFYMARHKHERTGSKLRFILVITESQSDKNAVYVPNMLAAALQFGADGHQDGKQPETPTLTTVAAILTLG